MFSSVVDLQIAKLMRFHLPAVFIASPPLSVRGSLGVPAIRWGAQASDLWHLHPLTGCQSNQQHNLLDPCPKPLCKTHGMKCFEQKTSIFFASWKRVEARWNDSGL